MYGLYVQVTVHRDNLHINNQQDASRIQNFILSRNCTCFGRLLCPSSRVISCTRGNWYVSCRSCGRCLGESGWNAVPTWPTPETRRVSWQNKILDTWCILLVIYTNMYGRLYLLLSSCVKAFRNSATELQNNCRHSYSDPQSKSVLIHSETGADVKSTCATNYPVKGTTYNRPAALKYGLNACHHISEWMETACMESICLKVTKGTLY